jgi:hypothetical protein
MFKHWIWIIPALALAGCNSANSRVSPVSFGSSTGIVTSGNLRLVTERQKAGYPPIVCTEPSPDYLVAFGSTQKLTASVPTQLGTRSLAADLATTEEVAKGEGRTAAVLALRDGLYVACQSYANGVIGQDAYSIILSQYGNLLVALVGNDQAAANVQVSGPQAAISAMTVACISGYDRSRDDSQGNVLLTQAFCRDLLNRVMMRGTGVARVKTSAKVLPKTKTSQQQTAPAQPSTAASGVAAATTPAAVAR